LGACSRLRRYHRELCFNIFALRRKIDFRVAPWRIFRVYPIESELFDFHQIRFSFGETTEEAIKN
jgi:hypothetical protein